MKPYTASASPKPESTHRASVIFKNHTDKKRMMGLFGHEQIYSKQYLNAEITDSSGRIHVVHIKYVLGDYFVTKIDGQTYVFRLKGNIYTYHAFAMKTVRKIYYNTQHYMPVSMEQYERLKIVIDVNKLPRINRTLFNTLRYLGKTERAEFVQHDMESLFNQIAQQENIYTQESQNMKAFLDHLNITQIVTPLKEVTEFFEGDMIASDPQFFGDVLPAYQRLDMEDKKITNTPVRGKKNIMKYIAIIMGISLVATLAWMLYSSGALDQVTGPFDAVGNFFKTQNQGTGGGGSGIPPDCQGTVEACKTAVDSGRVKLAQLPEAMQKVVQNFKLPTVTPKQQTVEVTP